ncbi:MAG: hypothetical protein IJ291_01940 [Lachnospiraceae bacterium]|nr:hypothetical protein [Lachnospiraceae bacterium]
MKCFKISLGLSFVVTILGLAGVICLGIFQSYVQLVGGLLWLAITAFRIIKGKPVKGKVSDYLAGRILLFGLILFFGVTVVSPVRNGVPFQYPYQMRYVDKFGYHNEFFPEELPDKADNYEMNFMPSIMQGSGWTNVSFQTDADTIAKYIDKMETQGCKAEVLAKHKGLSLLEPHLPEQIANDLQGSCIYVVGFSDDWNHPHIECMVVKEETGYVMFFEM